MKRKEIMSNLLTFGLLALGITFIGIGVGREEFSIVLQKAINICLECVGIG